MHVGLKIVFTWFKGLFQALVVGPVLRVPLLQFPVDLRSLLRPLQLQQQLSYTHIHTLANRLKMRMPFCRSGSFNTAVIMYMFKSQTIRSRTLSLVCSFFGSECIVTQTTTVIVYLCLHLHVQNGNSRVRVLSGKFWKCTSYFPSAAVCQSV